MPQYKEEYRRHLPHIIPLGGMFHVVFRIKDSIPFIVLKRLSNDFNEKKLNVVAKSKKERVVILRELYTEYFEAFETFLHANNNGPLMDVRKAEIVKNTLSFYNKQRYELVAFSIMPNHVHLLAMNVKQNLSSILKSIKGYSAFEINRLDGNKETFWQDESYDHMIRSRNEMGNTIEYILNNPVKSRLCNHFSEHPFTWCDEKYL